MIESGEMTFGLVGSQLTYALIAGGSVLALLIILVCVKLMSRPVPGYEHVQAEPAQVVEAPPVRQEEPEPVVERRSAGTPGFVLPLPSEAPQSRAGAEPAPPRAAPAAPAPPVERNERTVVTEKPPSPAPPRAAAAVTPNYQSHILFRSGPRAGEKVRLDGDGPVEAGIGRSEVAENQIVIRDDLKVSRVRHAIVRCEPSGQVTIRDNNSANKVFVNDQCIEDAPIPLNHGDRIRIGLTELEYIREPAGQGTGP